MLICLIYKKDKPDKLKKSKRDGKKKKKLTCSQKLTIISIIVASIGIICNAIEMVV